MLDDIMSLTDLPPLLSPRPDNSLAFTPSST